MKTPQKIFVTGGAGYIGSVAVAQLINDGFEVVVFDNLERGHKEAVHPNAVFIQGDLRDKESIRKAISEHAPDAVMHFAAYAYIGESMEDPMKYFENNVVGSLNLMAAAADCEVGKFIFSSTCATYGVPSRLPITEKTAQNPVNPYGESKLIVERMLDWVRRIHGMDVVILRYFNAAGATQNLGEDHDPEPHIIPLILRAADHDAACFKIFGDQYLTEDGTCVRDYIHITDLARAHVLALREGVNGSFNLGNGRGFSVLEVLETTRKLTGRSIDAEVVEPRPGDPPVLIAENKEAEMVLGWVPKYTELEDIIGDAWAWSKKHPKGYASS